MRILIVAEHASAVFGGEAALPLHHFRVLRQRGHDVWLLVHERTRAELSELFDDDPRIVFIPDTLPVRALWRLGNLLPHRVANFSTGYVMRLLTQRRQVHEARRLITSAGIQIVHQPMPVSPREPSLLRRLGAPVVIGPLNGGMGFPPSFGKRQSRVEQLFVAAGRSMTDVMNAVFPGKRQAAAVLVANERTKDALPSKIRGRVVELVENGVDLSVWQQPSIETASDASLVKFVFVGRLVDWKAVDLLLRAFKQASAAEPMSLTVIGDGPERNKLETQAHEAGLLSEHGEVGTVTFTGWLTQAECATSVAEGDALILPSLCECGGAVVLEAMALERPVIATDWGGPKDYLDPSCGILVAPDSPDSFVNGLAEAMLELARSPERRREMGLAAAEKVRLEFDWERKVDAMLEIYREVLSSTSPASPASPVS